MDSGEDRTGGGAAHDGSGAGDAAAGGGAGGGARGAAAGDTALEEDKSTASEAPAGFAEAREMVLEALGCASGLAGSAFRDDDDWPELASALGIAGQPLVEDVASASLAVSALVAAHGQQGRLWLGRPVAAALADALAAELRGVDASVTTRSCAGNLSSKVLDAGVVRRLTLVSAALADIAGAEDKSGGKALDNCAAASEAVGWMCECNTVSMARKNPRVFVAFGEALRRLLREPTNKRVFRQCHGNERYTRALVSCDDVEILGSCCATLQNALAHFRRSTVDLMRSQQAVTKICELSRSHPDPATRRQAAAVIRMCRLMNFPSLLSKLIMPTPGVSAAEASALMVDIAKGRASEVRERLAKAKPEQIEPLLSALTPEGCTAFHACCRFKRGDWEETLATVIEAIESDEAARRYVNSTRPANGCTALHELVKMPGVSIGVIVTFVNLGASTWAVNRDGETPADTAADRASSGTWEGAPQLVACCSFLAEVERYRALLGMWSSARAAYRTSKRSTGRDSAADVDERDESAGPPPGEVGSAAAAGSTRHRTCRARDRASSVVVGGDWHQLLARLPRAAMAVCVQQLTRRNLFDPIAWEARVRAAE